MNSACTIASDSDDFSTATLVEDVSNKRDAQNNDLFPSALFLNRFVRDIFSCDIPLKNSPYKLHGLHGGRNSSLADVHRFGIARACVGRSHDLTSCPVSREDFLKHKRNEEFSTFHTFSADKIPPMLVQNILSSHSSLRNLLRYQGNSDQKIDLTASVCEPKLSSNRANNDVCSSHNFSSSVVIPIAVPCLTTDGHTSDMWISVCLYPDRLITVERNNELELKGNKASELSSSPSKNYSVKKKKRKRRKAKTDSTARSHMQATSLLSMNCPKQHSAAYQNSSTFSLNKSFSGSVHSLPLTAFNRRLSLHGSSSQISYVSDLSEYETEYIKIKQLIAENPSSGRDLDDFGWKFMKPDSRLAEIHAFECSVKSLTDEKEDLEIQVHRLKSQLSNAIKEKEISLQRLETLKSADSEVNHDKLFRAIKENVDLQGKLNLSEQKINDIQAECDSLQSSLAELTMLKDLYASKCSELSHLVEKYGKEINEFHRVADSQKRHLTNLEIDCSSLSVKCSKLEAMNSSQASELLRLEDENAELKSKFADKCTEISSINEVRNNLSDKVSSLQVENVNLLAEKERLSQDLESVDKWQCWLKEQLDSAREARVSLQRELHTAREEITEVKSELSVSSEQVCSLKNELEETRAFSLRERDLLHLKVNSMQEDLTSYEQQILRYQQQTGNAELTELQENCNHLKVENKRQRHKIFDLENLLKDIEDKSGKKSVRLQHCEEEIKRLKQEAVINNESIVERNIRLDSIINQVNEKNVLVSSLRKDLVRKDNELILLREAKLKDDIRLSAVLTEKLEIDQATAKLEENARKLSSSLFKMKHDLLSKDREISFLKDENSSLKVKKELLLERTSSAPNIEADQQLDSKCLVNEVLEDNTRLQEQEQVIVAHVKTVEEVTNKLAHLENERQSLARAVSVRDEQIEEMLDNLQQCNELLGKKDDELSLLEDDRRRLETNCAELETKLLKKNNDIAITEKSNEENLKEIKVLKNSLDTQKQCLHMECKLKKALEMKLELSKTQHGKEKEQFVNKIADLENQIKSFEENNAAITAEIMDIRVLCCEEGDCLLDKREELRSDQSVLSSIKLVVLGLKEQKAEMTSRLEKLEESLELVREAKQSLEDRCDENSAANNELLTLLAEKDDFIKNLTEERDSLKASCADLQEIMDSIPERDPVGMHARYVDPNFGVATHHLPQHFSNVASTSQKQKISTLSESSADGSEKESIFNSQVNELQQRVTLMSKALSVKEQNLHSIILQMDAFKMKNTEIMCEIAAKEDLLAEERKLRAAVENKLDSLGIQLRDFSEILNLFDSVIKDINVNIPEHCSVSLSNLDDHQKIILLKVLGILRSCANESSVHSQHVKPSISDSRTQAVYLQTSSEGKLDQELLHHDMESVKAIFSQRIYDLTSRNSALVKHFSCLEKLLNKSQISEMSSSVKNSKFGTCKSNGISLPGESVLPTDSRGKFVNEIAAAFTYDAHLDTELEANRTQELEIQLENQRKCYERLLRDKDDASAQLKNALEEITASNVNYEKLSEQVRKLEDEKHSVEVKLADSLTKQKRCESNVSLLTRKLREHMRGRKEADNDVKKMKENLTDATNEKTSLKQQLSACRSDLEAANALRNSTEACNEDLKEQLLQSQSRVQQLQKEVVALKEDLAFMQEHQIVRQRLEREVEVYNKQLSSLQSKCTELSTELQNNKDMLIHARSLEEKITDKDVIILRLNEEVKSLRNACDDHRRESLSVAADRDRNAQELREVSEQLQKQRVDETTLLAKQKLLLEDNALLQSELKNVTESAHDLEAKIKEFEHKIVKMSEENEENVNILKANLCAQENECRQLQAQVKSLIAEGVRLSTLHASVEEQLRLQLKSTNDMVTEAEKRECLLNTELHRVQQQLLDTRVQLKSSLDTSAELRAALCQSLQAAEAVSAAVHSKTSCAVTETELSLPEPVSNVDFSATQEELPSPAPLDSASLQELLSRAPTAFSGDLYSLTSLQKRLSGFRVEMNALQDAVARSNCKYMPLPSSTISPRKVCDQEASSSE